MFSQEKYRLHECKEFPNSPPKNVLNETLKTHRNSVRLLQIDLRVSLKELHDLTCRVKNEDVLKMARNQIANLIRTVKVPLQKKQQSLLIIRQSLRKRAKTSHKPEHNFFLNPDRLSGRNNVTSDKVNVRPDIRQKIFLKKNLDIKNFCNS